MLEVSGLSAVYPGGEDRPGCVLEEISFTAERGDRIALIGANGAGKSTLLFTLLGLVPICSGIVKIDGTLLNKKNLPEIRRKLGLVFQNPEDQLFMPTVFEDLAFGPRNYGGEEAAVTAAAESLLAALGISHLRDRMSHRLSGGEQRMAALASVLILEPALLLLDEPSAFLDPRSRRRLAGVLRNLPQGFILATHDLNLALDLCLRTILLNKGRIRADAGTPAILADEKLLDECGLEPLGNR
jgi:cobalt/nickel transport system ATP-binding protein